MNNRISSLVVAALALAVSALPAFAAQAMPSVAITSPANGATVNTADIPVILSTKNFKIEMQDMGMPAKPGQGHVHVMVDGMDMAHLTNVEAMDHFSIPGAGLKPGKHTIAVMLAGDDHSMASKPAMAMINYEPSHTLPLTPAASHGTPSLTILYPKNGETVGRKFTLRVALKNFTLSCDEGKANVPGAGHLHVFVNQQGVTGQPMKAMAMGDMKSGEMSHAMKPMSMEGMIGMPCTDTIPVDLSAWKKGKATLSLMLAQNNHMPVAASPQTITVYLK
jgi:azurin